MKYVLIGQRCLGKKSIGRLLRWASQEILKANIWAVVTKMNKKIHMQKLFRK